jgi:hypothetical protein
MAEPQIKNLGSYGLFYLFASPQPSKKAKRSGLSTERLVKTNVKVGVDS